MYCIEFRTQWPTVPVGYYLYGFQSPRWLNVFGLWFAGNMVVTSERFKVKMRAQVFLFFLREINKVDEARMWINVYLDRYFSNCTLGHCDPLSLKLNISHSNSLTSLFLVFLFSVSLTSLTVCLSLPLSLWAPVAKPHNLQLFLSCFNDTQCLQLSHDLSVSLCPSIREKENLAHHQPVILCWSQF